MKKHKIGVIGIGFVGTAVAENLKSVAEVRTYDKFKETEGIGTVVNNSDILFVCVPTPMDEDGTCDTSIVMKTCRLINTLAKERKTIVIKSTVPPGTSDGVSKMLQNEHGVIFNPEFLTEVNFMSDFKMQDRIILGQTESCTRLELSAVWDLYKQFLYSAQGSFGKEIPIVHTDAKAAEMLKYTTNAFLATKITSFNEIFEMCEKANIDYDELVNMVVLDKRIANSHNKVPGPDGERGFGGKCLPKDLNGLINFAYKLSKGSDIKATPYLLISVAERNDSIRERRDWEEIRGATTKFSYEDE